MGGKFLWDDCKEVPEVLTSVYNYPDEGKIIQFEAEDHGVQTQKKEPLLVIFMGTREY